MKKLAVFLALIFLALPCGFVNARGETAQAAGESAAASRQGAAMPEIWREVFSRPWYDQSLLYNLPDDFRDALLDTRLVYTDGVYCYYLFDMGSRDSDRLYRFFTNGDRLFAADEEMHIQYEYEPLDSAAGEAFRGNADWQLFYEVNNCGDYYKELGSHYFKHLFLAPDGSFTYCGGGYEAFSGQDAGRENLDELVSGLWSLDAENFTLGLFPDRFSEDYFLHENDGLNDLFHIFTPDNGYTCGCVMFECEYVYANGPGILMYVIDPKADEQMAFYCLTERPEYGPDYCFHYFQTDG